MADYTRKYKILVIDDDENIRKLLTAILQSSDHEVILADGPAEGLVAALRERPDLILLDIFMEPVNGLQVLSQLRKIVASTKVPIIMLTAANTVNSINQAFELGANDYMTKPIDFNMFKQKVDHCLQQ
ncbi:MAG: response regulator [Elusimicrobiota bacterium]